MLHLNFRGRRLNNHQSCTFILHLINIVINYVTKIEYCWPEKMILIVLLKNQICCSMFYLKSVDNTTLHNYLNRLKYCNLLSFETNYCKYQITFVCVSIDHYLHVLLNKL